MASADTPTMMNVFFFLNLIQFHIVTCYSDCFNFEHGNAPDRAERGWSIDIRGSWKDRRWGDIPNLIEKRRAGWQSVAAAAKVRRGGGGRRRGDAWRQAPASDCSPDLLIPTYAPEINHPSYIPLLLPLYVKGLNELFINLWNSYNFSYLRCITLIT